MSNQISWTIVATAVTYEIQRAPDNGSGSPGTFADISESPISDPTISVVHAAGVSSDFYRVRAVNTFGNGAYSSIVQKISVPAADLCNVFGNIADVTGIAKADVIIKITLNTALGALNNFQINTINSTEIKTDSEGNFSFNLIRQDKLTATDSTYTIEFQGTGRKAENVIVPAQATVQYKDLSKKGS